MVRPLDSLAFHAYVRRLGFTHRTQELLAHIRSSPPSRIPGARHGNMPVWYPSKKMQCVIKAESAKVEFAFLLQAEHDDDVLEIWDQPPSIPLAYRDRRNRLQRPLHTADYFVFRSRACGWIECKPTQELVKQVVTRPHRYRLDEQGRWRCPPGEAFAEEYGLTYHIWASDQIRWAAQDNWLFLEDYYQDLECLAIPETVLARLTQVVAAHPGILLADLRVAADLPADLIHVAIARHALYVDLARHRLSDPWHTPVFPDRRTARAYEHRAAAATRSPSVSATVLRPGRLISWDGRTWQIAEVGPTEIRLAGAGSGSFPLARSALEALVRDGTIALRALEEAGPASIAAAGRSLLERARDVDLATAVFRNRVIHPEQYADDAQESVAAPAAATIPARTKRRWRQWYAEAEDRYGSGFIGLIPQFARAGRKRAASAADQDLIQQVLATHYDTATRQPKRGAHGEYLQLAEEQQRAPLAPRTFYREIERHKAAYEQTLVREGARAAYPFKDYAREQEQTVGRHGNYTWAMGHLDHTELDLLLCDSRTGGLLGKCWLTLLVLSQPRRIAAYYLTFDPPSYRSCLMVLRLCVKRYGRLPTAITVDGGSEFQGVYFEQLLALYRVRKHQRPASEPRFGSPQERLFGTMDTEFLYHLLGNTQAMRAPRTMTTATDPRLQAVWTLPALAERIQRWADEEYETIRHPALGMTPREAYDASIARDGARRHKAIPYDETFRMATLPTTRKGTAQVEPGVGVRMNYLYYWCEAMRDPSVERAQVQVRYDPFDLSVGYAYVDGQWRQCFTAFDEFAGCSERELHLLAAELRQRNRLQYGRERTEITQKQLAAFRRENVTQEAILRRQRHDRETRAALSVLEGGTAARGAISPGTDAAAPLPAGAACSPRPGVSPADSRTAPHKLLVFKRIPS